MSKALIETLIDTNLASGTAITATEVRDVLKDDTNSLLNTFYPSEITDTQATQSVLTLFTSSVNFNLRILKTGRKVSISCTMTALIAVTIIGVITAGEFTSITGQPYYSVGYETTTSTAKQLSIVNSGGITNLLISPALEIGETVNFTIFYNSSI